MKQKSKVYPYFVANQVLKSKSLNDAFFHLDEQGRVTRTNLFGHGIIEGLTYTWKDGVLTIDKGEAVTSNGWYIQFTGKEEYRYAAEVFLGENPSEEVYPFNDDSLLALLKDGGSRVCYACFKTEDEAHEFHHRPTPIIEIPAAHYAVALVCGTRNHSRSACTEDSCDINVTQKDCEVWPVLVNIYATFKMDDVVHFASVPPIYKKMEPCWQSVLPERCKFFYRNMRLTDLKERQRLCLTSYLSGINQCAQSIARDILGQEYDFRESFKVQKSVWKDLFDNPREVISRFYASVVKVSRLFSPLRTGYPDYCLSFMKDYADALTEFIQEYNSFIARHPYLPLRDPMDCLVYLGSARNLDKQTGASCDQTYRSHFIKAHDVALKEDALRLERFLRRISLLTEAFVGPSWQTLESTTKMFKLVPCRPGAKISDRPIPFYYNASYQDFKRCWRAGDISPVTLVRDYTDGTLPFLKLRKNGQGYGTIYCYRSFIDDGTELYLQGYQGMNVKTLVEAIRSFADTNDWAIQIEDVKIYNDKEIQRDRYLWNQDRRRVIGEHMGGLTSYCTITIFHYRGKVVTYTVSKFVK